MLWGRADSVIRGGASLHEPGTVPLRAGEKIRLEAVLNRAAYAYLFWIDAERTVHPVSPWPTGTWRQPAAADRPTQRISLPPLPDDVDLQTLTATLPWQEMQHPEPAVWFAQGQPITQALETKRAPNFFDPEAIGDPMLTSQRIIQERLGEHFTLHRAVSFANQEGP